MSDVLDAPVIAPSEQPQPGASHRPHEQTIEGTRLAASLFNLELPAEEKKPEEQQAEIKPTDEKPKEEQVAQPAASEWFKNYGWESEDAAKAEIERVKNFKPVEAEIKFENDQSKQIHELIRQGKTKEVKEFLVMQDKLDGYTTGDVSKDNADEIIKLGMKLNKEAGLSDEEINHQFNKKYRIPSEPVQAADELDEDFLARKSEWQSKVNEIQMDKIIDAKMMRPQLNEAKSKLVLPEIQAQQQAQVQLTPEQVEANKKFDDAYINSVEQSVNDFSGFSLKVKNEDVGLPEVSVPYLVTDAEKVSLSNEMKDWVNKSYDANAVFDQRWVNKDGTVNTKQMAEDRYLLNNRDAIFQKLADETAKKAIEAFVKGKKNITIKEGSPDITNLQGDVKTEMDKIREVVFA